MLESFVAKFFRKKTCKKIHNAYISIKGYKNMEIEKYSFGSITINGKEYDKDLIIFKDKVFSPWWREEGHNLSIKDLQKAIEEKPSSIVIGTGADGVMKVPGKTLEELEKKNIEPIVEKTGKAIKIYNEKIHKDEDVIACLHLTC